MTPKRRQPGAGPCLVPVWLPFATPAAREGAGVSCGRTPEHHGPDYDLCECGDARVRHPDGTAPCQVCYPHCRAFRFEAADHDYSDELVIVAPGG